MWCFRIIQMTFFLKKIIHPLVLNNRELDNAPKNSSFQNIRHYLSRGCIDKNTVR